MYACVWKYTIVYSTQTLDVEEELTFFLFCGNKSSKLTAAEKSVYCGLQVYCSQVKR